MLFRSQGTLGNQWTYGKIGKAGSFNGTDNYVQTTYVQNSVTAYTVAGWIKTTSTNESIIAADRSAAGGGQSITFGIDGFGACQASSCFTSGTGKPFIILWANSTAIGIGGNTAINDGKWHYVVGTWAASNGTSIAASQFNLYVDSILVASPQTRTTGSATSPLTGDSGGVTLGIEPAWSSATQGTSLNGLLDNVRIYNYVRSQAQIAWEYNQGRPIGLWKFDECQGAVAHDSSGFGNDGTINLSTGGSQTTAIGMGTCTSNASTPWFNGTNGKFNSSLNFDGIDDNVSVANTLSNVQSIAFWVKPATASASLLQLSTGVGGADIYAASGVISTDSITSPTKYVNGKVNGTLIGGSWNHVMVTTGAAITANNILFGKLWRGVLNGQLDDVRIFNYPLTKVQVQLLYNDGAAMQFAPVTGIP